MTNTILTRNNCNHPIVSVIIPVYNRESLINQAIDTVCQQTIQDWELILIDDRSTDQTTQMIQSRIDKDSRIKLFTNSHTKGPSGARNQGLDKAMGKYIAYQDSDDEWEPYHLETMIHYLEKYPEQVDLMTANPLRKYRENNEVFNYDTLDMENIGHSKLENAYIISPEQLFDTQLRGRVITTQNIVAKAEILKKVRWNEVLNAAEDNLHNLQLSANGIKVGHIQDFHTIYWAHNDNITNCNGSHSPEKMERVLTSFVSYWRIVLDDFELSTSQRKYVEYELANTYAWHLGYNTFEPQKKFKQANSAYLNALKLKPTNINYWKSYIKSFIKWVLSK